MADYLGDLVVLGDQVGLGHGDGRGKVAVDLFGQVALLVVKML